MSDLLSHRGTDGLGLHCEGSFGLACQNLWVCPESVGVTQPLRSGALFLSFDGRLDNREELTRSIGISVSRNASDAELVLECYRSKGERFAERLVGDFALALFDGAERRLFLARDSVGIRPLYYAQVGDLVAFASEMKAILAHPDVPCVPNEDGLVDHLMECNRPLVDQQFTCFREIHSVVPAHVVAFGEGGRSVRRYWDFDPERRLVLADAVEYGEAFREQFSRAVARRLRSAYPIAVSTSGGLDSSSIFCMAETLRAGSEALPPVVGLTYTHPAKETDEIAYVADIERKFGVSIERIQMDPCLGVLNGMETQIWHIEAPMVESLWGVDVAIHRKATEKGARRLLTGHWGDQMLFCQNYLVDLARRFSLRALFRHLKEYERWYSPGEMAYARRLFLLQLLRYHSPDFLVLPLKRLRRWFLRWRGPKPYFSSEFRERAERISMGGFYRRRRFHSAQAWGLYLEARSKYHVHSMETNNKVASLFGMEAAFPFLDRDLLQFLMSVPGEAQNPGGVPRGLLRSSLREILPDSIAERKWKADFSHAVNLGIGRDAPEIVKRLSGPTLMVERGYVDGARLSEGLDALGRRLDGRDCVQAWAVSDLLGLEAWLRLFGDKDKLSRAAV